MAHSIEDEIRYWIEREGKSLLNNPQKIYVILKDGFPNKVNEIEKIGSALNANLGTYMYNLLSMNLKEQAYELNSIHIRLKNSGVSDDAIDYAITTFCKALGINNVSLVPSRKSINNISMVGIVVIAIAIIAILGMFGKINRIDEGVEQNKVADNVVDSNSIITEAVVDKVKEFIVDSISEKEYTAANAEIIQYTGNIATEDQIDIYDYVSRIDGIYNFKVYDVMNGTEFKLLLKDSYGEKILQDNYCVNENSLSLDTSQDKSYTISVVQKTGYSSYRLVIGQQKPHLIIEGYNVINDSVEFEDQKNVYYFTPPVDGTYSFQIKEVQNGVMLRFSILDRLKNEIAKDSYCVNGNSLTLNDAKANELYEIVVSQKESYGDYQLVIGEQKEIIDISSYDLIKDSIQYVDQSNVYSYTIPENGTYKFVLSEMVDNMECRFKILNYLGETVTADSYCRNGNYLILENAKRGETYKLQVSEKDKLGPYQLNISKE